MHGQTGWAICVNAVSFTYCVKGGLFFDKNYIAVFSTVAVRYVPSTEEEMPLLLAFLYSPFFFLSYSLKYNVALVHIAISFFFQLLGKRDYWCFPMLTYFNILWSGLDSIIHPCWGEHVRKRKAWSPIEVYGDEQATSLAFSFLEIAFCKQGSQNSSAFVIEWQMDFSSEKNCF